MDMESNIVKFPFGASCKPRVSKGAPEERDDLRELVREEIENLRGIRPAAESPTARNARLRIDRKEAWRMAEAAVQYWRARLDVQAAIERAQRLGIPEGRSHPADDDSRQPMVEKWRAALVRQLLTPAPDANSVKWKQMKLASELDGYYALDVKPERIERSIADDLAFLAAHPTRRSNSEAMARSREFKEAMRQRIRDLAASRDLPDDEIKSVLRLKHQEIGAFAVKHSVSLAWLLEGAGPIFKKYSQQERDWSESETGDDK